MRNWLQKKSKLPRCRFPLTFPCHRNVPNLCSCFLLGADSNISIMLSLSLARSLCTDTPHNYYWTDNYYYSTTTTTSARDEIKQQVKRNCARVFAFCVCFLLLILLNYFKLLFFFCFTCISSKYLHFIGFVCLFSLSIHK